MNVIGPPSREARTGTRYPAG
jgi:hypothetical protein